MRGYFGHIIGLVCLALLATSCDAQIELSTGFDLSYPELINSNNARMVYGQQSFGVRVGVAYKPAETQFFPILNISFGRTRLPLKQFGENIAVLNFDYINVMLNENYIVTFPKSQLFIYGGVGFSYLINKGIKVAGTGGETMRASIDSTKNVNNVFPAMNIGFEYNYGESTGKDLYLTMGLNFQYILLLAERNTYDISIATLKNNYNFQSSLTGNVISPGFYIALHYIMHKKKGSSLYL